MPDTYEVIFAARESIFRSAKDDVRNNPGDPQTPKGQEMEVWFLADIEKLWLQVDLQGNPFMVTHANGKTQADIDILDVQPPGQLYVLWAGDTNGVPHGITILYDEDGNEIGTSGTPTYDGDERIPGAGGSKRIELLLDICPDVVTYDENGNETSRTRPPFATQNHSFWSWASSRSNSRRYDLVGGDRPAETG